MLRRTKGNSLTKAFWSCEENAERRLGIAERLARFIPDRRDPGRLALSAGAAIAPASHPVPANAFPTFQTSPR